MARPYSLSTMILLTLFGSNVAADSNPKLFLDELVVTGTRSESALGELAGNTGKVSKEEIDLLNADHIEESLSRVSGVHIQRGNGAESLVALRSPVLTAFFV